MREYTLDDFVQYYNGAFVLNPTNEKEVLQVHWDRDQEGAGGRVLQGLPSGKGAKQRSVALDHTALEWRHVRRPQLGYRHLNDGKALYFLSLGQHEGRPKGLNPHIVTCRMPEETVALWNYGLTIQQPSFNKTLNIDIAQEAHFPSYVSRKYAINALVNEPAAIGFALSCDAAITLGTTEHEQFVGLFKGRKVSGAGADGRFHAVNPSWEGIVTRHFS